MNVGEKIMIIHRKHVCIYRKMRLKKIMEVRSEFSKFIGYMVHIQNKLCFHKLEHASRILNFKNIISIAPNPDILLSKSNKRYMQHLYLENYTTLFNEARKDLCS